MGSTQAFVNQQLPAARAASARLGIPVSVVLAQWIDETGSGTSKAFLEGNNYAGVSYLDQPEAAVGATLQPGLAPILAYPTRAAGVAGYINRWLEPVYASTRATWATTSDPIAVAQSIEASPWAAAHYGGNGLEQIIAANNLTAYDNTTGPVAAIDTSGTNQATLTSFNLGDPFSGITDWLKTNVLKLVFVGAGLVLIVGGFLRAAAPRARAAVENVAPLAAAAV